jgi:hypothetical protein
LALADDVAGHYPVSATPAISDIAGLNAVMNVQKVPFTQKYGVLHPITQADYISLSAFVNAEKSGDTQTLREASMGKRFGIEWFMDQNVPTHTQPVADAAGTVISGASVGSGTMIFAAITASSTILANDVFKITGQDSWHKITTNSTGGTGGLNTAVFTPVMTAAASAGDVVTIQKTHRQNLAFHKNAFCLATATLEDPIGGVDSAALNLNGLSVRMVRGYTQTSKRNMLSLDLLIGTKTLDQKLAARLCDAR